MEDVKLAPVAFLRLLGKLLNLLLTPEPYSL